MTNDNTNHGQEPARIRMDDEADVAQWAKKLDSTEEQLKEAVAAVGDKAADVEMHLKGTRSTTNAERIEAAGQG
ncbi:MAG: DUF3606 domain-containing protein [Aquincola tertiaricarbonis]|uniref:DUF3606 domain-containing protein n=1 Tax=Aquincola TaxID=391952 RepID=UPI0006153D5E|nr:MULTISPECIES: DUF3606 domain-containing protein [Aquincola]MCR5867896.1 DUF3606 domain-containing protein [Aquincola sp. J276]